MRPLLAIIISVAIFGGLNLYMQHRVRQKVKVPQVAEQFAAGVYSLDLTFTFQADYDAFALEDDPIVRISFRGEDLLLMQEPVKAGEILYVDQIKNIVAGQDDQSGVNEFYYEILTGDTDTSVVHAVRLRLFLDGQIVADHTAWSDPGEPVRGTFRPIVITDEATHGNQQDFSSDDTAKISDTSPSH